MLPSSVITPVNLFTDKRLDAKVEGAFVKAAVTSCGPFEATRAPRPSCIPCLPRLCWHPGLCSWGGSPRRAARLTCLGTDTLGTSGLVQRNTSQFIPFSLLCSSRICQAQRLIPFPIVSRLSHSYLFGRALTSSLVTDFHFWVSTHY